MIGAQNMFENIIPMSVIYRSLEAHLSLLKELSIVIFVKGMEIMIHMSAFTIPKEPNLTLTINKLGKLMLHKVLISKLMPKRCQKLHNNNCMHLNHSLPLPTMLRDLLGNNLKTILLLKQ